MYAAPHARQDPDRPAVIAATTGEALSYGALDDGANRFARYLRAAGLDVGDHVAVVVENHPRFVELLSATERAGLYVTPVNTHLTAAETAYILDDSGARVVVTSRALLPVVTQTVALAPGVEHWLCLDGGADLPAPFIDHDAAVASHSAKPGDEGRAGATMLYTSGTTGRPKGVQRPLLPFTPEQAAQMSSMAGDVVFRLRAGATYLAPAPLYHAAPLAAVNAAIDLGLTTVLMDRFDPEAFLALVERHRVTHVQVVPTMLVRMLRLPAEVRDRYDLSSLEAVVHAGAPCPEQVKRDVIDWLGPIVYEFYSGTEGLGLARCDTAEWLAHPGTVGRAVPPGSIVVGDEDGNPLPAGEVGTVWFRSLMNFEYRGDSAKTAGAKSRTGELATLGDLGYLDEDGFLHLTDRGSHLIISGGVNIYPREAEDVLTGHPAVADVAVIGVPDEEMGESVKAVVQLVDGVTASEDLAAELIAHCRADLSSFKCPRSVDFVDELPRLPTGKMAKHQIRSRYWPASTS